MSMITITTTLTEEQVERFRESSQMLGVSPEEAARLCIESFLSQRSEDLDQVISEILDERAEVLRRLAR